MIFKPAIWQKVGVNTRAAEKRPRYLRQFFPHKLGSMVYLCYPKVVIIAKYKPNAVSQGNLISPI